MTILERLQAAWEHQYVNGPLLRCQLSELGWPAAMIETIDASMNFALAYLVPSRLPDAVPARYQDAAAAATCSVCGGPYLRCECCATPGFATEPAAEDLEKRAARERKYHLNSHPLLMAIYETVLAIEKCGASPELTAAVMHATGLYEPARQLLAERDLAQLPPREPDQGMHEAAQNVVMTASVIGEPPLLDDLWRAMHDAWTKRHAPTDTCDAAAPLQDAEDVARQFHEAYETLAPSFGYETRKASRVPWKEVPANNKLLMIAVVRRLFGKFPQLEHALRTNRDTAHIQRLVNDLNGHAKYIENAEPSYEQLDAMRRTLRDAAYALSQSL